MALAFAALAATGIAACGNAEPARPERGARLTVYERPLPDAVGYTEGSIGVVRVERVDGSLVAQRRRLTVPANRNEPRFDQPVPEGLYRVVSFQATCAPACGPHTDPMRLDPFRSQECQRPVRLEAGATATVTAELGAAPRRCHFRTGVPSAS